MTTPQEVIAAYLSGGAEPPHDPGRARQAAGLVDALADQGWIFVRDADEGEVEGLRLMAEPEIDTAAIRAGIGTPMDGEEGDSAREYLRVLGALDAARAEIARLTAVLNERYPCDGLCVDAPEEDCSRHGRTPAELWEFLNTAATELATLRPLIDYDNERVDQAQHGEQAALRQVAAVRAWAMVNEIAPLPLDWKGLGAILNPDAALDNAPPAAWECVTCSWAERNGLDVSDAKCGHTPPAAPSGAVLIAAERQRQLAAEGWTPEHDDEHDDEALARAAACYALPPAKREMRSRNMTRAIGSPDDRGDRFAWYPAGWPWSPDDWKPTPDDRVRELVKAGALIAAEIDRRIRGAAGRGKRGGS